MDDTADPLHQFFSEKEASQDDILYTTLELTRSATVEEIRKAYRRLALHYHPDKHSAKSSKQQEEASKSFQKIGFAYAVLSDEKRRKVYDGTGKTDERWSDVEEMGWDKYFEGLFERVDRKMLDEDKKKYQGSSEEEEDLKKAYIAQKGSLPAILNHIPHSSYADEDRLIGIINKLISNGDLEENKKWKTSSTDKTAKAKRGKIASKEAKKAEEAAKELGVWDEFYGSGKKGKRNSEKADENDQGGLQALILKRQQERSGALDRLAEKYAMMEEEEKSKKRGKKRKSEVVEPEMTDAEFEALQAKMFGDKATEKKKDKKRTKA